MDFNPRQLAPARAFNILRETLRQGSLDLHSKAREIPLF